MTLEVQIETEVCNAAERQGWVHRKLKWIGRDGAPDRVFFGHGRCVFIEFKRPGEVPKGQQAREVKRLRTRYPEVYVCDSIEDAKKILGLT